MAKDFLHGWTKSDKEYFQRLVKNISVLKELKTLNGRFHPKKVKELIGANQSN